MYGIILRLDAGRQQRVGTDVLKNLLSPTAYQKLRERPRALNSSLSDTMPFAPTLMRPAMYPERFRVTELRTMLWKLKNMNDLHELVAMTFDDPEHIVFIFSESASGKEDALVKALKACNHDELVEPSTSGKKITFKLASDSYSCEQEDK